MEAVGALVTMTRSGSSDGPTVELVGGTVTMVPGTWAGVELIVRPIWSNMVWSNTCTCICGYVPAANNTHTHTELCGRGRKRNVRRRYRGTVTERRRGNGPFNGRDHSISGHRPIGLGSGYIAICRTRNDGEDGKKCSNGFYNNNNTHARGEGGGYKRTAQHTITDCRSGQCRNKEQAAPGALHFLSLSLSLDLCV